MNFVVMAHQCAPQVHVSTLMAVVRHESGFDPLAIHVNGKGARTIHPKSRDQAVRQARALLAAGINFDAGYGQVNMKNWSWLGLTPETVFDPCTNLAGAQRVLVRCYQMATSAYGRIPKALYAALSCYNTGNLTAGFENGYVQGVIAEAGLKVPALSDEAQDSAFSVDDLVPPQSQEKSPQPPRHPTNVRISTVPPRPNSPPDGFAKPRPDAFSHPRPDAFSLPMGLFTSPLDVQVGSIIVHPSR